MAVGSRNGPPIWPNALAWFINMVSRLVGFTFFGPRGGVYSAIVRPLASSPPQAKQVAPRA